MPEQPERPTNRLTSVQREKVKEAARRFLERRAEKAESDRTETTVEISVESLIES
jgi:hypothetical protein